MTITFDKVFDHLREAFESEAIKNLANQFTDITVIRDIYGKIHLYIHCETPQGLREETRQVINDTLTQFLGDYYSNDLWESNSKKVQYSGLVDILKEERRPHDFGVSYNNWYLLERYQAKHVWSLQNEGKPPWPAAAAESRKPAIVSFFSFKGGAGRTTALIGTALTLARAKKRVVIVDLDLEAPGLAPVFFPETDETRGVIDYLIEKGINPNTRLDGFVKPIASSKIIGETGEVLRVLPAGTIDQYFLPKLARLDFQHLTMNNLGQRLKDMLLDLTKSIPNLDFILLDARAGFHDIGGFTLNELSHAAVIVGQHTQQTWAGLTKVIERLAKPNDTDENRLPLILLYSMAFKESINKDRQSFKEKAYDVFQKYYFSEDEMIPNSNDTEAPFQPVTIPWSANLRGNLSLQLFDEKENEHEHEQIEHLVQELTSEPYRQVTDKLVEWFNKHIEGDV